MAQSASCVSDNGQVVLYTLLDIFTGYKFVCRVRITRWTIMRVYKVKDAEVYVHVDIILNGGGM